MISENSGVSPDGEEYSLRVEEIINLDHSAILNPESEPGAKNNVEAVGMFTNGNGESAVEVAELHVNACSPNLSLPLAPADYAWNETEAVNRIRKFSGSESAPSTNYRKFFMEFDAANVGDFGSYKMPFADVIDGRPYAVPAALEAINAESVADADRQRIIANVEHYKSKIQKPVPNSKLAQFLNWFGKKVGIDTTLEYNRFVTSNSWNNEVEPMKDKILAALNAAGVKTEGLDDDALFAAYNEAMKPKAEMTPEEKAKKEKEDADKKAAANGAVLEAVNALAEEIKQLKAANAAAAQAEIDAVAAQVANAGIMELEEAKKLSVKSLNGLLAKSGVVVANGAGGFSQAPKFEPMPE